MPAAFASWKSADLACGLNFVTFLLHMVQIPEQQTPANTSKHQQTRSVKTRREGGIEGRCTWGVVEVCRTEDTPKTDVVGGTAFALYTVVPKADAT